MHLHPTTTPPSQPLPGGPGFGRDLDELVKITMVTESHMARKTGFLGRGPVERYVNTTLHDIATPKIGPVLTPEVARAYDSFDTAIEVGTPAQREQQLIGPFTSMEDAVRGAARASSQTTFDQMMGVVEAADGALYVAPLLHFSWNQELIDRGSHYERRTWPKPTLSTPLSRPNDWPVPYDDLPRGITREAFSATVDRISVPEGSPLTALVDATQWFDLRDGEARGRDARPVR